MKASELSIGTILHFRKQGEPNEATVGELLYMFCNEFPGGFFSVNASKFLEEEVGRGPTEFYFQPNLFYRVCGEAGFLSVESKTNDSWKRPKNYYKITDKALEQYEKTGMPITLHLSLPAGLVKVVRNRAKCRGLTVDKLVKDALTADSLQDEKFSKLAETVEATFPKASDEFGFGYLKSLKEKNAKNQEGIY